MSVDNMQSLELIQDHKMAKSRPLEQRLIRNMRCVKSASACTCAAAGTVERGPPRNISWAVHQLGSEEPGHKLVECLLEHRRYYPKKTPIKGVKRWLKRATLCGKSFDPNNLPVSPTINIACCMFSEHCSPLIVTKLLSF